MKLGEFKVYVGKCAKNPTKQFKNKMNFKEF
jgi:hypothetical protein